MATVISQTKYTGGRGKGILGIQLSNEPQRLGKTSKDNLEISKDTIRIESTENYGNVLPLSFNFFAPVILVSFKKLLACYDYTANPNKPGGFTELTIKKGKLFLPGIKRI